MGTEAATQTEGENGARLGVGPSGQVRGKGGAREVLTRGKASARDLEMAVTALDEATRDLSAPLAAVHLPSLRANLSLIADRAAGTRVRIASKSVRTRGALELALGPDLRGTEEYGGTFRGIMAYSLREALWLVELGCDDVLLGYPTVDRNALAALAEHTPEGERARAAITLMVDSEEQVDIAESVGGAGLRLCIDVDCSLRIGPIHLGTRRSPVRTISRVAELAGEFHRRGHHVLGAMFYEAQVAGVQDNTFGIGPVKRLSMRRLVPLRQEVAATIAEITGAKPEILNSGGTGSIDESASAPAVTEVTAGSGLFVPGTFDHYRSFAPRPSLFFALDAVRRPAPGMTTLLYGGYVASGAPGADRLPVPASPPFRYTPREGAGEVQTPIRDAEVPIGGRAWLRHAKAGELAERFAEYVVVDTVLGEEGSRLDARAESGTAVEARSGAVVDVWSTYRGEGKCFG